MNRVKDQRSRKFVKLCSELKTFYKTDQSNEENLLDFSEILLEEKHQQQETMRRENRRVQAMSWGT